MDESLTEKMRSIADKYEQVHKKLAETPTAGAWAQHQEASKVLTNAASGTRFLNDQLDSLGVRVQASGLPDTSKAVADLTQRVGKLEVTINTLQADMRANKPVERTSLDYVAGRLARITICKLIGTLIAGPILATLAAMPFSPWVAKMIDVSFSSFLASAATEIGVAATRKIDG